MAHNNANASNNANNAKKKDSILARYRYENRHGVFVGQLKKHRDVTWIDDEEYYKIFFKDDNFEVIRSDELYKVSEDTELTDSPPEDEEEEEEEEEAEE